MPLPYADRQRGNQVPRVLGILGLGVVLLAGLLAWLASRPNRSEVDARLGAEFWAAVSDGIHNSNTDMIEWQGDLHRKVTFVYDNPIVPGAVGP